jgi:hypothetical protein
MFVSFFFNWALNPKHGHEDVKNEKEHSYKPKSKGVQIY